MHGCRGCNCDDSSCQQDCQPGIGIESSVEGREGGGGGGGGGGEVEAGGG